MEVFKKPLSSEMETFFLSRAKDGDLNSRNQLIEYNLRLVMHIAKKYQDLGTDSDDLLQTGVIGLIKAIDTYNLDKGNRLSSYASKCIENEILMKLRSDKKTQRDISIFEPIGNDKEGNEITLLDTLKSEEDSPLSLIEHAENISQLKKSIPKVLNDREQKIISLRYGIDSDKCLTQRETSHRLNISRSYVSRIEKRALQKLASALNSD